jgi:hypothetical protein
MNKSERIAAIRDRVPLHPELSLPPAYPIERICRHRYEPFQLTFARHALQLLPDQQGTSFEASHRGLALRAENETALERPVRILQSYFGNQISIGIPMIRYHHQGDVLEEPHMVVEVTCLPEHFDLVRSDLENRKAVRMRSEIGAAGCLLRATVPLARLIGYAEILAGLTETHGRQNMWLSHYAPVDELPPTGGAA